MDITVDYMTKEIGEMLAMKAGEGEKPIEKEVEVLLGKLSSSIMEDSNGPSDYDLWLKVDVSKEDAKTLNKIRGEIVNKTVHGEKTGNLQKMAGELDSESKNKKAEGVELQ
uniref:Uncharacterized protein n=1 Tax=Nelumbo nucifera TaxID=4432 RepID=A0A822XKM4_NELNU|nr:TPA_asm: hypothetical protein HUJ06_021102 [Nelumbo nucifera]